MSLSLAIPGKGVFDFKIYFSINYIDACVSEAGVLPSPDFLKTSTLKFTSLKVVLKNLKISIPFYEEKAYI
jgi:hypothetical protein